MIGILCGLRSEALIADRMSNVLIGCSAAQPARARQLVQQMIEKGVNRLISFGLCGGLSSDLAVGDLIVGMTVMSARDTAWEADSHWNSRFIEHCPDTIGVPVWASDHMASRVEDKAMIFRRTGCLAVDMESHIVASMAQDYGLPFNVVRAVSDPFDMALPPAARVALKEDASVNLRAVFAAIREKPSQLPDLIRLGLSTSRAMRSLRHAVEGMGAMA